jgi:Na+-translocating ferredoxin:NAD+ oxidoreductase RnfG subunit
MKKFLFSALALLMAAGLMAASNAMSDQIVKEILPDTDLKPQVFAVNATVTAKVQEALGNKQPVRQQYEIYTSKSGAVILEEQMGKWGIIKMAIAVDTAKKVSNIGFISMSEKRGAGIKQAFFIKQFVGKSISDSIEVGKGITALSGATVSSKAVAIAVKRALIIYDAFLAQGKPAVKK